MREGLLAAGIGALVGLLATGLDYWWRRRRARPPCRHTGYHGRAGVACLACRRERERERIAGHLNATSAPARRPSGSPRRPW